jgi:hypothetical protein
MALPYESVEKWAGNGGGTCQASGTQNGRKSTKRSVITRYGTTGLAQGRNSQVEPLGVHEKGAVVGLVFMSLWFLFFSRLGRYSMASTPAKSAIDKASTERMQKLAQEVEPTPEDLPVALEPSGDNMEYTQASPEEIHEEFKGDGVASVPFLNNEPAWIKDFKGQIAMLCDMACQGNRMANEFLGHMMGTLGADMAEVNQLSSLAKEKWEG